MTVYLLNLVPDVVQCKFVGGVPELEGSLDLGENAIDGVLRTRVL